MIKALLVTLTLTVIALLPATDLNVSVSTGVAQFDELDTSLMSTVRIGRNLTEVLDANISFGYYNIEHQANRNIVRTTNPPEPQIKTEADVSSTFIPVLMNIQGEIPLTGMFSPIIGTGLGWSFLNEDVEPLDQEYLTEDYSGYSSYHGLTFTAFTGIAVNFVDNIDVIGKVSYLYSNLNAKEDLQREGFARNDFENEGYSVGAAVRYSFR